MTPHRCPYVAAVVAGDLEAQERLLAADGDPPEGAVRDLLEVWARRAAAGLPAIPSHP